MKQQINLYVRQEKQSVPFSAVSCGLIVLVSTLMLFAVYGYNWQGAEQLRVDVKVLKRQQSQLQSGYDRARSQMSVEKESPVLKDELQAKDREIIAKRRYEALLDQLQPGRRIQFSSLLDGLSAQVPEGIWLTRIVATDAGSGLSLEGGALKPDLVPRYLKRLGGEAVYQRARFDQLLIEQASQGLSFQVSARLPTGGAR